MQFPLNETTLSIYVDICWQLLLFKGVELTFVCEDGAQCGWEWIPMQVLQRVCDVLDKLHPLGCDYRMLAEVLDVHKTKLQQFLRFCSTSPDQSITRVILQVQYFLQCLFTNRDTFNILDLMLQENLDCLDL